MTALAWSIPEVSEADEVEAWEISKEVWLKEAKARVREMVERLPPEYREPVLKHYMEKPGVVERLMQLLGLVPMQPLPEPEVIEIEGIRYSPSCNVDYARWEIREAKRLIKWVMKQQKQKEFEELAERLLGKDWRERKHKATRFLRRL